MTFSFTVYGDPVTQGSARAFVQGGRARIVTKTDALIAWRETVRQAAVNAAGPDWDTRDEPALVRLAFYLPRPKSAPKTKDILPSHGRTDLDKYIRAALDAIVNAGIITDDTRVVDVCATKRYAVSPALTRIYDEAVHRKVPGLDVEIEWVSTSGSSRPSSVN